jgi:hypothetical protein
MATKKNAIVKNQKIDDMIAAGVEVKLTKMEIADYIAQKAKEELLDERNHLQEKVNNLHREGVPFAEYLNDDQKDYIKSYNKIHGSNLDANTATLVSGFDPRYDMQIIVRNGAMPNVENDVYSLVEILSMRHNNITAQISIPLSAEQKELPFHNVLKSAVTDLDEINQKIANLDKKSHRTLLVENILNSSESGKKVLTDLKGMVKKVVKGD